MFLVLELARAPVLGVGAGAGAGVEQAGNRNAAASNRVTARIIHFLLFIIYSFINRINPNWLLNYYVFTP